ncbi:hypothetical protein OFB99_27040, partial [Escherichia coli]|nr:hypothetical protein [Escherichia coli]
NGDVHDPGMRLPATFPSPITTPQALGFDKVGIDHGLHWVVPVIGIASSSLCQMEQSSNRTAMVLRYFRRAKEM